LVVGEVRGAEVTDLLAAMNTGHEGGCGTIHANSAGDVPSRIEALAMSAGMPREAAHSQLSSAIEVVAHLRRDQDGRRRLAQLAVPQIDERGLVGMKDAIRFPRDGDVQEDTGADLLARRLELRS